MATIQLSSNTPSRSSSTRSRKRVASRTSRVSSSASASARRSNTSRTRNTRTARSATSAARRVRTHALRSGRSAQELATAAARRRREVMLNVARRDAGPTLWPEDTTGISSLSERVVINVEHASFILSWTLLSAIVTAVGIVLLLRAPLVF